MYIPLAVHKNELVEIDSMDTFSRYFCLAKKQKMTPLAADDNVLATHEEIAEERGEPGLIEEETHTIDEPAGSSDLDDDDI